MTDGVYWRRIKDDLSGRIRRGEFAIGDPIPSTRDLVLYYSTKFGRRVSREVVRHAVTDLQHLGVLRGEQGVAVVVVAVPDEAERAPVQRIADLERNLAALWVEMTGRPYPKRPAREEG